MQFYREYKLRVGAGGVSDEEGITIRPDMEISELDISFSLMKSSDAKQNKAKISIFNLSRDSRERIAKENPVTLSVRYGNKPFDDIFVGEIATFSHKNLGQDIETILVLGDGYIPVRQGFTNRTFSKGTRIQEVFETILVKDMGLVYPVFYGQGVMRGGVGLNNTLDNDRAFSGQSKQVLDSLAASNNLEWYIRDGLPIVAPFNTATTENIVLVSPETGLIGSPERIAVDPNKRSKDLAKDGGYKFSTLLNPKINVGNKVRIKSMFVDDVFKVTKVTHKGSFEGNDWMTTVESIGIQQEDT